MGVVEELMERYRCPIWVDRDGCYVPVRLMSDRYLLNVVGVLQGVMTKVREMTAFWAHPFWGPTPGSMAEDCADMAMEEAWDREYAASSWLDALRPYIEERGLEWPEPPAVRRMPAIESAEVVRLPGGGSAIVAKLATGPESEREGAFSREESMDPTDFLPEEI